MLINLPDDSILTSIYMRNKSMGGTKIFVYRKAVFLFPIDILKSSVRNMRIYGMDKSKIRQIDDEISQHFERFSANQMRECESYRFVQAIALLASYEIIQEYTSLYKN